VVAAVEHFPSGALSHSIDNQEHRNRDAEPCIMIEPNGPYAVKAAKRSKLRDYRSTINVTHLGVDGISQL